MKHLQSKGRWLDHLRSSSLSDETKQRSRLHDLVSRTLNPNTPATQCDVQCVRLLIPFILFFSGYHSSFTVYGSPLRKTGPTNDTVLFPYVVSNIGGHYNTSTGVFTCPYNGTYYFTFNLYKVPTISHAYCKIRKNGVHYAYADSYPGLSNTGSYNEATASMILHLVKGDNMDIGGPCSATKTFDNLSSFSGFLVKAD